MKVIDRLSSLRSEMRRRFLAAADGGGTDGQTVELADSLNDITSQLNDWQRLRHNIAVLVLVLVDDEPVSFSAVRAHIFPGLVKSVLEHVHCRSIYNMLLQTVPDVDHSVGEE